MRLKHQQCLMLLGLLLTLTACSSKESSTATESPKTMGLAAHPKSTPSSLPPPRLTGATSTTRVSSRPGNPKGEVFVLMYHHFKKGVGPYFRTPQQFRGDLERLYKDGFRPVTASEYLNDKMPLPPGASPVVITMDDANPTQFRILPDGRVDPNCAVGIWQAFAKKHPDFPVHGTFFVLPSMWGQHSEIKKKVQMLTQMGSELGNHTINHPDLRDLSDAKVEWEIAEASIELNKLGGKGPYLFAYPFGVTPRNKSIVHGFSYKGNPIHLKAAFLVGANPAPAPDDRKLNLYRIPRIGATKGSFGLDYWLDKVELKEVKLYVQP